MCKLTLKKARSFYRNEVVMYRGKTRELRAIRCLIQWNRYRGIPRNTCFNISTIAIFTIGFDKKITRTKEKV